MRVINCAIVYPNSAHVMPVAPFGFAPIYRPGVGLTLLATSSASWISQDVSAYCDEYCLPPAVYTELCHDGAHVVADAGRRDREVDRDAGCVASVEEHREDFSFPGGEIIAFFQVLVTPAGDQSPDVVRCDDRLAGGEGSHGPDQFRGLSVFPDDRRSAGPDGSGE
jgi:hypothetical protein